MKTLRRARSSEELGCSVHRFDAVHSQTPSAPRSIDRSVRRWAKVRFILGFLQMFGKESLHVKVAYVIFPD